MIESYFPTPIAKYYLDQTLIYQEIQNIKEICQTKNLENPWGDTVETTFKYDTKENMLENMPVTYSLVLNNLKNYYTSVCGQENVEITESWINFSGKNQFQHFHIHPRSDVSGVLYLETTGNDGDITFYNPSVASRSSIVCANFSKISIKPENAMMLVFPGHVDHAVEANSTDHTRISLSFNSRIV